VLCVRNKRIIFHKSFYFFLSLFLIIFSLSYAEAETLLVGDANGDCIVDNLDYDIWLANKRSRVDPYTNGDFNGDGKVNKQDKLLWQANEGNTCSDPDPTSKSIEDATIVIGSSNNYGSTNTLLADLSDSALGRTEFLIKLNIDEVGTQKIKDVKLSLYGTNGSSLGPSIHAAANTWSETNVTGNNAPEAGALVAEIAAVTSRSWHEVDLSSYITGDGTYSLRVVPRSSNGSDFGSTESANAPKLEITYDSGGEPPPQLIPPVARTGSDQTIEDDDGNGSEGTSLDGSASVDADGFIVSYVWSVNGAQIATGGNPTGVRFDVGSHDVLLTVTDNDGLSSSDAMRVTVQASPPDPTSKPIEDATIAIGSSTNYGSTNTLEADLSDSALGRTEFLIKLNVDEIGTKKIKTVKLSLYGTNGSSLGPSIHTAANTWSETNVTGNNAPPAGATVAELATVTSGSWHEVDLSSYITGDGIYSFRVVPRSSNGSDFGSTESANPPILEITYDSGLPQLIPPVARTGSDQTIEDDDGNGSEGTSLDGSASSDADGSIVSYLWSLNGSQIASGANPTGVRFDVGFHDVLLTVTDNDGLLNTDTVVITVTDPSSPPPPLPPPPGGELVAFPGAEGYGAKSVGGRGGRVIQVTNLNDSGTGSLRDCIAASGARTCIFRTGGTIALKKRLKIDNSYLTIAGQTAPGGGITIKGPSDDGGAAMTIKAHDVVIRYIRIRVGSHPNDNESRDAITIGRHNSDDADEIYNIVIDHCSLNWSTDEVMGITGSARNISVQWTMLAEPLNCSTHIENPGVIDPANNCHAYGMLITQSAHSISVHHSLFAHGHHRLPRIANKGTATKRIPGTYEVVNNIIYNPGDIDHSFAGSHIDYGAKLNYIGNFYKPGPNTPDSLGYALSSYKNGDSKAYVKGNICPDRLNNSEPEEWAVWKRSVEEFNLISSSPFQAVGGTPVNASSAFTAYDSVLADVGANFPVRDAIDARIVQDVIDGTGTIIGLDPANPVTTDSSWWPFVAAGTPPADTDKDGMPDSWEQSNGLDKNNANDGAQEAASGGYTNLEIYLDSLTR